MTEAEWRECTQPWLMFGAVDGITSDRKFRLFACACYRVNWHSLTDNLARNAILLAERYSDGLCSWEELHRAERSSHPACWHLPCKGGREAAWDVVDDAFLELIDDKEAFEKLAPLATLFREVFGNPFRSIAVDPSWLGWQDSTVAKLAQGIYHNRAFDRLPILADALEDAGCDNADILAHCRSGAGHVRGCWVVDLLTGRT